MALRRVLAWSFAAALIHSVLAAAIAATRSLYGEVGAWMMLDDVRRYDSYSASLLAGAVPYRDYALEYPPLALPIFLVPRLGAAFGISYQEAFAVWMLAISAATIGLVAWWVARHEGPDALPARLIWLTFAATSLCPMLVLRYDLAPAALAFAAACLWYSGRSVLGGTAAGTGFLMKIFPVVVAIPALAGVMRSQSRRTSGLIACALIAGFGVGLWLVVGAAGAVRSIEFHSERGLEIGSLYSGFAMAVEKLAGRTVRIEYLHASAELTTPWTITLANLALPIQAASLLAVAVRSAVAERVDPMRDATAALIAFMTFGKVLSPQYLIWALPFVAVLPRSYGRTTRLMFLCCCALTTLIFPWAFDRLLRQAFWAVVVLNVRNGLLVALYAHLLGVSHVSRLGSIGQRFRLTRPAVPLTTPQDRLRADVKRDKLTRARSVTAAPVGTGSTCELSVTKLRLKPTSKSMHGRRSFVTSPAAACGRG
jgi:hypothetical protein